MSLPSSHQAPFNNATVQVLSGLNVGETLSLSDGPVVLGGSDDCDLFLVDPNINGAACVLECLNGEVVLSVLKGSTNIVHVGEGENARVVSDTYKVIGKSKISINGIWLSVEPAGVVSGTKHATESTISQRPASDLSHTSLLDKKRQLLAQIKARQATKPVSARNVKPTPEKNLVSQTVIQQKASQLAWFKPASVVITSMAISLWMISAARGVNTPVAYTANYPQVLASQNVAPMHDEVLMVNNLPATGAGLASDMSEGIADTSDVKLAYLQHLRSVFQKMLMARELPTSVTLNQQGANLVVQGLLPESKHSILQRMLVRFQVEQGIEHVILNQVKKEKHALPFDIVQVTSGRYGNIVTDSGERLFVGDQLEGYQLVAIQPHHVIFSGKSRVTIAW